jgi:hypothetical protein
MPSWSTSPAGFSVRINPFVQVHIPVWLLYLYAISRVCLLAGLQNVLTALFCCSGCPKSVSPLTFQLTYSQIRPFTTPQKITEEIHQSTYRTEPPSTQPTINPSTSNPFNYQPTYSTSPLPVCLYLTTYEFRPSFNLYCIGLYMALQPFVGPRRLFQFLDPIHNR